MRNEKKPIKPENPPGALKQGQRKPRIVRKVGNLRKFGVRELEGHHYQGEASGGRGGKKRTPFFILYRKVFEARSGLPYKEPCMSPEGRLEKRRDGANATLR